MWLAQSRKCYHAGFPLIKPGYIVISLWLHRHTTELTEWILFVKKLKVQLLLDIRSSLLSHSYFMFLSAHILSDELDDYVEINPFMCLQVPLIFLSPAPCPWLCIGPVTGPEWWNTYLSTCLCYRSHPALISCFYKHPHAIFPCNLSHLVCMVAFLLKLMESVNHSYLVYLQSTDVLIAWGSEK